MGVTDATGPALSTLSGRHPQAHAFARNAGLRFLLDASSPSGWAFHDHTRFGAFAALPRILEGYVLHEAAHVAWWFLDLEGRRRCVEVVRREGAFVLGAAAGIVRRGWRGRDTGSAEQVLCAVGHLARRFPARDADVRLDEVSGFWDFSDACREVWSGLGRAGGGVSSAIGLVVLAEAARHLGLEPREGADLLFEEACATLAGADPSADGMAEALRREIFPAAAAGIAVALDASRLASRAAKEWLDGGSDAGIDLAALACQASRWARTRDGVPCLSPMCSGEWAAGRGLFEDERLGVLIGAEVFQALRLGPEREPVDIPAARADEPIQGSCTGSLA